MLPSYDFFIIGGEHSGESEIRNLKLLPRLKIDILEQHIAEMDIGVGNLNLEIVGRRTPSPLKVREYIAQRLPCIIAHEDPDLDGAAGVLNLGYGFTPTSETAEVITHFVDEWAGRLLPEETVERVSAERKEDARIEFIREVWQHSNRSAQL